MCEGGWEVKGWGQGRARKECEREEEREEEKQCKVERVVGFESACCVGRW
jgi:hypothetical protein